MNGLGIRKVLAIVALGLLAVGLAGCESLLEPQAAVTGGAGGPSIGQAQAEYYNGPKARIAVLAFDNKTGKGHRIGEGMAEMLTTALFETNRFIVLERRELGGVIAEQDLATAGRVRPDTAIPTGQIEGAELLVTGAITEFEPRYQGGGIGVVMPRLPLGLGGRLNQAHIAIDMRVVDARTSRILSAVSVTGRASDFGGMIGTAIGGGSTRMGIGLGAYRNTPMEKAVRVCIIRAVQFVVSRTPPSYYHYSAQNQPIQVPIAPGQPAPGGAYPPPGAAYPPGQPVQPTQPTPAPPAQPVRPGPVAPAKLATPPPAAGPQIPTQVYVTLQNVRVYSRPQASSAPAGTVSRGTALNVTGEEGNWYAVMLPDGRTGWVLKNFTSTTAP